MYCIIHSNTLIYNPDNSGIGKKIKAGAKVTDVLAFGKDKKEFKWDFLFIIHKSMFFLGTFCSSLSLSRNTFSRIPIYLIHS